VNFLIFWTAIPNECPDFTNHFVLMNLKIAAVVSNKCQSILDQKICCQQMDVESGLMAPNWHFCFLQANSAAVASIGAEPSLMVVVVGFADRPDAIAAVEVVVVPVALTKIAVVGQVEVEAEFAVVRK
jgi:hypothetical protein